MNSTSDKNAALWPLICFGSVVVLGVFGFGYAKLTNNGFALIGFLVFYVPFSLFASALGAVFAVKAFTNKPSNHWVKYVLFGAIVVAGAFILICFSVIKQLDWH
jgi:divalent metal cation (Fe/Co/Zn/Cd) transporter